MEVKRLNMFGRLRDFKVPTSILDEIFSNEDDLKVLQDAYQALLDDSFSQDEAAEEISKLIFKELDITPDSDQSFDEEK